jgi:hypothetical protein
LSRLRRREILPEDTSVHAVLSDAKLVYGQFGRQLEVKVRILDGDYRNAEFKDWFSFRKDDETGEEYVSYGSPLYDALALVNDDLDSVLDNDDLSDRAYEKFLKASVAKLNGLEVLARVGVRVTKNNPEKKRNFLQAGTFGPYRDPDDTAADLDMGEEAS